MLSFIIGLFISYFYHVLVLPKNEGSEPLINPTIYPLLYKGMVIIPYNKKYAIHLHHWLLYLLICILSLFFNIPEIIIGFSIGLLIQGFTYKDFMNFIRPNPYS